VSILTLCWVHPSEESLTEALLLDSMFIGEMMCLVAFALQPYFARFRGRSTDVYEPLSQEDDRVSSETVRPPAAKTSGEDTDRTILPLAGWAKFWFLLPTICDLTGTTLMNVGLIYTPVSIYQMTRGLLVLWVGIFSVIFLRRKLYAYQWVCLVLVTTGVALVGLAGSLVKKAVAPDDDEGLTLLKRVAVAVANMAGQEDPAKVFIGVLFIAGAQIFTASQFVRLAFGRHRRTILVDKSMMFGYRSLKRRF
jgi:drug/metabolite transporter (DMT)-like permease